MGKRRDRNMEFQAELDARATYPQKQRTKTALRPLEAQTEAQAHYMMGIASNVVSFGVGVAGTGKAQPLTSKVLTPNGWLKMGDMAVGMVISMPDGQTAPVTGVFPQETKDIYRITFEDGRVAESCDEHLWKIYRYNWGANFERVVPLSEVRRMLALKSAADRLYIPLIQPAIGVNKEFPIHPYVLGALLGDGHIGLNCVRISSEDDFILDKVNDLTPDITMVHYQKYDYGLIVGKGRKNPLLDSLRAFDLAGRLSYEKIIPDEYMNGSLEQRISLLNGLMDTDGSVDNTGAITFTSTSEVMAIQVQELIRSLGGIAKITNRITSYTHKGILKKGRISYNVRIRMADPKLVFSLPRKVDKISTDYQYANLRLRIKSVDLIGQEKAQCIAIDHPDHLYITDNYVVTHNTYICTRMGAELLKSKKIERLVVTRPAVEAGGGLGFLPGTIHEKFAPYFAPFRDVLDQVLGPSQVEYLIKSGAIDIQPLEYIRGLTFDNAFVILDEAQNTTPGQMKLFLSRVGNHSKVVINGDISQQDIEGTSGLEDAINRLEGVGGIGIYEFDEDDIVRSGICREIMKRYR